MTMEQRSVQRSAAATFRMTPEENRRIKQEAADLGLTFQQLFQLRMLGGIQPTGQPGRPRKSARDQELPLAG